MRARIRPIWGLVALASVWLAVSGQQRLSVRNFPADGVLLLGAAVVLFLLAVVWKGRENPPLWPNNSAPRDNSPQVNLTRGRLRRALFGLAVVLAAVAFASLAKNRFTVRGVVCWVVATVAWILAMVQVSPQGIVQPVLSRVRSFIRERGVQKRVDWVALCFVGILALSFFFHLYRVSEVPAEPQSDHVEASEDVRSILKGQYMIYFPRNTGREGTQFYLTALLSRLFGYGFTTLKLTMALVGMLNIIPMYFLGKELADRKLGLLAAFAIAVSYWHLIVSRIGWRIVLMPFWTTTVLWLLLRALRTGRRNDYIWTGLALGAGLYGYMSFRIMPFLVIVFFGIKWLFDREPGFSLRRLLGNLGTLVGTAALVYLPLIRYQYDEPRMYWYRVLTRTTDLERPVGQSSLSVFVDNVRRALLMFNWTGDAAWTASVPTRPILDYVSGGLFVLGTAYLLYLLVATRRPLALYWLAAVFLTLLPSTMSVAFPIENPSNIRASGVIPVMLVLVALPLYLVGRQVLRVLRGGLGWVLVLTLGGLLLYRSAVLNFHLFYVDYDEQYRRAAWNARDMARVMNGFADTLGSIYDAYCIGTAYWVDHRAIALSIPNMEWNNLIMDMREAEPHLLEPRNRLYIYNPSNTAAERWLLTHYPNGQLLRYQAFQADKDFMVFYAPAQQSPAPLAGQ
ncbi:MAG TPA: glycosyltransferase family 39 protein [Anaerolineae bacterium]|nr:glycosyltransferase family 39 protein [Anaerolineae bacterium]